jgi:hypothetical protein
LLLETCPSSFISGTHIKATATVVPLICDSYLQLKIQVNEFPNDFVMGRDTRDLDKRRETKVEKKKSGQIQPSRK